MNDLLFDLYSRYWDGFMENVYRPYFGRCAYPFLIQVPEHYENATKRVMICGQETQGWGKSKNPDTVSIKDLQLMYYNFMDKQVWRKEKHTDSKRKKSSPYWNFNKRMAKSNPDVGFIFQNVVKVGKYENAGCDNEIYKLAKQYFPTWLDELKILKPDLIIFLSGDYDWRIREVVGNFEKTRISENLFLDELHFENPLIPKAYRTNHPGWLQRNKRYFQTAEIMSDIIKNVYEQSISEGS